MSEPTMSPNRPVAFRRFWQAYAVSAVGSGVGAGALPLIAILVLHAGAFEVSTLAAIGAVSSAVISVPLGSLIDARDKRRVMVVSNAVRFAALATIPVAIVADALTFAQLCGVAIVQTTGTIAYNAAGFAYVKAVVPAEQRTSANARIDSVNWITQSAGPPAGGALIAATTPFATVVIDSLSYLASALLLRRIPAAAPIAAQTVGRERARLLGGWQWIFREPTLRMLYINAMLFGGAIMWSSPLLAVLVLQQMQATPLEYGLVLGVPCLGGLLGAVLSSGVVARFGQRRALLVLGLSRVPWPLAVPFAGSGTVGIAVITASNFLLLTSAGLFNPVFATYRMEATPDHLMARVGAAWSVSSKSVQPAFITVGGIVAATTSIRLSLVVAAALCLLSGVFLPYGALPCARRVVRRQRMRPPAVINHSPVSQSVGPPSMR
ncbi:MFS transporter [Micromonospora sp. NPDC006766]|uniref:MFS transporter n=1 Tax=Micromonospora sp. NPDC006766 TaxID=3154778 RepID=UPI003408B274